ncbi:MAG: hypothetical protein FJ087_23195, partial [Deltaproteobacteria bacterium]|nr:hypothetical protein [Deltaproteobacteria bacterium]
MIGVAAGGKVILFGEHAVVHGRPALALGIPRALVAESIIRTDDRIAVRVPEWGLDATGGDPGPVGEAIRRIAAAVPGRGGCEITARARIPAASGLGGSAAAAVLLARALAGRRGSPGDDESIRLAAHEGEKAVHGSPSGVDDAVATFGGLCLFRGSGVAAGDLAGVPFARLAPVLARVGAPAPRLVVGHTGVARSTADLVAGVRARREADPAGVEALFDAIEAALRAGLLAIRDGDPGRLGAALDRNQEALASLGVSSPAIERMLAI